MEVVLAVDNIELEEHIQELPEVSVTGRLTDNLSVISLCEDENPDILIISNIVSAGNSVTIINDLHKSKYFTGRVIYLINTLDAATYELVELLEGCEFYDFLIGEISTDELEDLMLCPRIKRDAKTYLSKIKKQFNFKEPKRDKVIEKTVYVADEMCIGAIGNAACGKSFLVYALALNLAHLGNKVGIISFDSNNTLHWYFDVDDMHANRIEHLLEKGLLTQTVTECYRTDDNIGLITLNAHLISTLGNDKLTTLVAQFKAANDILLLDGSSESEIERFILSNTAKTLTVFDQDVSHFNANCAGLLDCNGLYKPAKSIVVINKSDKKSASFKETLKNIKKVSSEFMDVCFVPNLGSEPSNLVLVDSEYKDFSQDLKDSLSELLVSLKCTKDALNSAKRGSLFMSLFSKH